MARARGQDAAISPPARRALLRIVLDGVRHERVAWSYEAPREALRPVAQRVGFWEEVEVG
jgi:uncharacterized protein (DUF427 family)